MLDAVGREGAVLHDEDAAPRQGSEELAVAEAVELVAEAEPWVREEP